ncbi:hypothetical protein PspLS_11449 [Pyricularia sp. CBS 133598]|nr:hypothetical protein PspLS_11449 [Pyricularia sp. CBS 133598]
MPRCNHNFWLALDAQQDEAEFLVSDKLQEVFETIPSPDVQKPSLVVVIGEAAKKAALEIFGIKRNRRSIVSQNASEIHLHIDPSSVFSTPLLIAETMRPRSLYDMQRPVNRLHTNLLAAFTDVFCLFCEDFGGLDQTAIELASWLDRSLPSSVSGRMRPRLIVVVDQNPGIWANENNIREKLFELIRKHTVKDPNAVFSAVETVALFPDESISRSARHRPLKERMMDSLDSARNDRLQSRHDFSATHFGALFKGACAQFAGNLDGSFNFVKIARNSNPIAQSLHAHLSDFLSLVKPPSDIATFAAPMIASSFLLDNYPPGTHYFHPEDVVRHLYKGVVTRAFKKSVLSLEGREAVSVNTFVNSIEAHLRKYVESSIAGAIPTADIHSKNLARFANKWAVIKSSDTCLVCLRRRPLYDLCPGHTICDNCVRVFGLCADDDPSVWTFEKCLLCQNRLSEKTRIRIHPPTAGVGVLCLDGGGVRGTLVLEILKRIEERVNLPVPLQRFVKIAFGISSGGLIVADMFVNGSSIAQSTKRFELLAGRIFRRRELLSTSRLPSFLKLMLSWLTTAWSPVSLLGQLAALLVSYFDDGLYSSQQIESVLKHIFGADKGVLDVSSATANGNFVGLPVATVDEEPMCRIFTNRNGAYQNNRHAKKPTKCLAVLGSNTHDEIVPTKANKKLTLWEIARAASAAPGIFSPKHFAGLGTFQDAGPLENDPLLSALTAMAAYFPDVEQPDFILSIGTGESKPRTAKPCPDEVRNVWKNGAFPRLCRLFSEKIKDKKLRQLFQTSPRYHRLDVQFDGDLPRLDDFRSIPELQVRGERDQSISGKIERIARCLVASLFYFELDAVPQRSAGKQVVTGRILCTLSPGEPGFTELFDRLRKGSACFWIDGRPVERKMDEWGPSKGCRFQKQVQFTTQGSFSVSLKQDREDGCEISGSPFSADNLVNLQGLRGAFGRSDHKRPWTGSQGGGNGKRRRLL